MKVSDRTYFTLQTAALADAESSRSAPSCSSTSSPTPSPCRAPAAFDQAAGELGRLPYVGADRGVRNLAADPVPHGARHAHRHHAQANLGTPRLRRELAVHAAAPAAACSWCSHRVPHVEHALRRRRVPELGRASTTSCAEHLSNPRVFAFYVRRHPGRVLPLRQRAVRLRDPLGHRHRARRAARRGTVRPRGVRWCCRWSASTRCWASGDAACTCSRSRTPTQRGRAHRRGGRADGRRPGSRSSAAGSPA